MAKKEYVVVVPAEDLEEAKQDKELLEMNDIPVQIQEGLEDDQYAVKVPKNLLAEAQIIIQTQDAYDDLDDFMDEEYLDEDLLEDEEF